MSIYERVSITPSDSLPPTHQALEMFVDRFGMRSSRTFVLPSVDVLRDDIRQFAQSKSLAMDEDAIQSTLTALEISIDGMGYYPHVSLPDQGIQMIQRERPVTCNQLYAVARRIFSDTRLHIPYSDNPAEDTEASQNLYRTIAELYPEDPLPPGNISFALQLLGIRPDHEKQAWILSPKANILRVRKQPFDEKWVSIRQDLGHAIIERAKSHPVIVFGRDFTVSDQGVHSVYEEYLVFPDERERSALTENFAAQIGIEYHDILRILSEDGFIEGHHSGKGPMGKQVLFVRKEPDALPNVKKF